VAGCEARTILDCLHDAAASSPESDAILSPGRPPLSFARLAGFLDDSVGRLRGLGVTQADRVAVVLPNGPEMATAFLAVASAAACAPLNPGYTRAEFEFYLKDLRVGALVVPTEGHEASEAAASALELDILRLQPDPSSAGIFTLQGAPRRASRPAEPAGGEQVALVLHTSGTTSRPKIVPLTHSNLVASARQIRTTLGLNGRDRCLNVMPLFHIHGLVAALLSSLSAGASVVCSPGYLAPRFLDWLAEFRPTWYTAVPSMHQGILERARRHSDAGRLAPLRLIRSSSAALAPALMEELEHAFQVPVIEAYGMTEASHQIASNPLPPGRRKPGSVGLPAGPELAVMDERGRLLGPDVEGEIVIRGPNVAQGYEANPEANKAAFADGWFRTGDRGRLDQDGYVFLSGRTKEIINRGGEKISPREIDEALVRHPAVRHAVAFAVPDEKLGEEVAAAVVLHEGATATERQLRDFVGAALAPFKVPRRIVFVTDVPKGPTGKIQRIGLAAKLEIDLGRPGSEETPSSPLESTVTEIFREILDLPHVDPHADFFELGGDSVLAAQVLSRLRARIGASLSMVDLFDSPTAAALARAAELSSADASGGPIPTVSREGPLPLSVAQNRLWILTRLEPDNPSHHRPEAIRILGPLDRTALERSLEELLHRHEALRSAFSSHDGKPAQSVLPPWKIFLETTDLSGAPSEARADDLRRRCAEEARRPFDIVRGPLLRCCLFRLSATEHVLLLAMHHLIYDGWSAAVLYRELASIYDAFRQGRPSPLPPLPLQYADYASWQQSQLDDSSLARSIAYWRSELSNPLERAELPLDRPRPAIQSHEGAIVTKVLSEALTGRIRELARTERATLFMTLLSALQCLVSRMTDSHDVIVGCPVMGRTRPELELLIGFFVNTLAIRLRLEDRSTFREALARTRDRVTAALDHSDLAFERLVDELSLSRDLSRSPLFDVFFQMRPPPSSATERGDVSLTPFEFDSGVSRFDLNVDATDAGGRIHFRFEYDTRLFDRESVAGWADRLELLLERVTENPDAPLPAINLLLESDRELFARTNDTDAPRNPEERIDSLFEEQVERTPDADALRMGPESISYRELNGRSNRIARLLVRRGVGPEAVVAVCMDRSSDLWVALLAILKAGAAYLPLDPRDPRARKEFMLQESEARLVLADRRHLHAVPSPTATSFDAIEAEALVESPSNLSRNRDPEGPAYLLYTSGSTGRPKGVLGLHKGAVNRFQWMWRTFPFEPGEVMPQKTAATFVDSVWEMFGGLLRGVPTAIVAEERSRDPNRLVDDLSSCRATRVVLVPSLLRAILDHCERLPERLPALKVWTSSGEPLSSELARRFFAVFSDRVLLNLYGSTEISADATWHIADPHDGETTVPIGRPIDNTKLHILNRNLAPVPQGWQGEICISGAGLARGYWKRSDLERERFVVHPETGERIFRTGDLGRMRPTGEIEILGRLDDQIKLLGMRIDPSEVEAAMRAHSGVLDCAVVAIGEGPQRSLMGVYVSQGNRLLDDEINRSLSERLPAAMRPRLVRVDRLPRLPNDKLDRRELTRRVDAKSGRASAFVPPADEWERGLAALWEELLQLVPIGVQDDFFGLGGNSLLAAVLFDRIERRFGISMPLATLFQAPTIRTLRGAMARSDRASWSSLVSIKPSGHKTPFFCVHPLSGNVMAFQHLARHFDPDRPLYALQARGLDGATQPRSTIEEMAEAYLDEIRRIQPRGPYLLGGRCIGGIVAFEMARRLARRREAVPLLVILDTLIAPTRRRVDWISADEIEQAIAWSLKGAWLRLKAALSALHARRPVREVPNPLSGARFDVVAEANLLARKRYRYRPYAGRTLLFRSRDVHYWKYLQWKRVCKGKGNLRSVFLRCSHLEILHTPMVERVTRRICQELDQATG
jgi:amino acid adenylation domain-containing protein